MPEDYKRDDYMTPAEVAEIWGVSAEAVRQRIRSGDLPALRLPGIRPRYLVKRSDADLRPASEA